MFTFGTAMGAAPKQKTYENGQKKPRIDLMKFENDGKKALTKWQKEGHMPNT